jgi:hypothetical protein
MYSKVSVIKAADDVSLLSLYHARLALNLTGSNELLDEQVELLVRWSSDEIAACCNRVFAKETVIEAFRDFLADLKRLHLSRWPVSEITSLTENGTSLVEDSDYELDPENGRVVRLNGLAWVEPVVVTYTGGYDLPYRAPPALQQAAMLLTREGYYATSRGDATVRMLSHGDSRIIYFDPMAKGAGAGTGPAVMTGSPARKTISALLEAYIRLEV